MQIRKKTVFDTPILKHVLRFLTMLIFRIIGWKLEGKTPNVKKYVMIAAPHTSNWDFAFTLMFAFAWKLNIYVMGKKELFQWPFGYLFSWLGTIPIDRSKSNDIVGEAIEIFNQSERMILLVPPSGTRRKVRQWKTGFYHIANGANVPIALGFLDYGRKKGGFGPLFEPTGDVDTDMMKIKAFYADISGKYPEHTLHVTSIRAKE